MAIIWNNPYLIWKWRNISKWKTRKAKSQNPSILSYTEFFCDTKTKTKYKLREIFATSIFYQKASLLNALRAPVIHTSELAERQYTQRERNSDCPWIFESSLVYSKKPERQITNHQSAFPLQLCFLRCCLFSPGLELSISHPQPLMC